MDNTSLVQQERNPLELPEIVHRLGCFVGCTEWGDRDYLDLFHSLLVCKTWYHALLPSLYEEQSDTGISRWNGPKYTGTSVKNHQYFVRMLNLQLGPTDRHFPNLEILSIRYRGDGHQSVDAYAPLLQRHSSHLRIITLYSTSLNSRNEFAAVLGQMPKLTELVLTYCYGHSPDDMLKIILSCQKLERLRLDWATLRSSPSQILQTSTKLVHLSHLGLFSLDAISVATIVSHCPSLKTLSWSARTDRRQHESHDHMRAIVHAIRQFCPNLEHIEGLELFRGAEGEEAWFLAELVQSVKRLRTFTTTYNYHVPWSYGLLKALLAHQDTLEVIRTPTGTVSPWMRINHGYKIDPNIALLPSATASATDMIDNTCEKTSSWSLPPITTACSKQPSVVSTLLYQCSRLRIVELPYVGLEHFGGLSRQYGGQAWKCRVSLQQLIFTRAQHMVHLSLKRLSKHKNTDSELERDIEREIVEQLQACLLTDEGNANNDNTAKAQRVLEMMDDLAQQLELCPRLWLFTVGEQGI